MEIMMKKNNSGVDQDVQKGHTVSGLENSQSWTRPGLEQAWCNWAHISWEGTGYLVQI